MMVIEDRLLGTFVGTGEFRAPKKGEYYQGTDEKICLATEDRRSAYAILVPRCPESMFGRKCSRVKGHKGAHEFS